MLSGALADAVSAHDYWIQAAPYVSSKPTLVNITLQVGDNFDGSPQSTSPNWHRDFSFIHDGERRVINATNGPDPAAFLPADKPGLYMVGYENYADHIEMKAEKWNRYLEEEGLQSIVRLREAKQQSDLPGREYYQRCAKSLVLIGDQPVSLKALQQPLGYRLEIIPLSDPYTARNLQVQLLYDGKPQAGLLVTAFRREAPLRRQHVRTDADGRATISLRERGEWLVKTVHMVSVRDDARADWSSYWATLTFLR